MPPSQASPRLPIRTGRPSLRGPFPTRKLRISSLPWSRSRATCRSRGRWTASSVATSASARLNWPCGPPSRPSTTAGRSLSWYRPRCWPSSTSAPSASASPSTPSWLSASADSAPAASRGGSSSGWPREGWTSSSAPIDCSAATFSSRTWVWSSSTRNSASESSTRTGSRSCAPSWTC